MILYRYFFIYILVSLSTYALCQKGKHGNKSISTSNTIVNEYTVLTQNASVGDMLLYVQNSELNSNSRFSTPLQKGDLLMVYQAQGASSSSFESGGFGYPLDNTWGAVSNYNNSGLYEFVQVESVPNNFSVNIDCGLINNYTVTGKTQVIRVPRYSTLSINSGGVLTCDNWDGNKGGVVSVEVVGNTIVHSGGSIYATGKGFRGGELDNDFFWGGGQWASINSIEGAEKGEGILGYKNDYNIYGGRYCRGAPANGGGGGNTHNSGGGGGANGGNPTLWNGNGNPDISNALWITAWNLEGGSFANSTSSGGGRGGYSFSGNNEDAMSLAPASAAWGGDHRRNNGGLGGRPLDFTNNRIFFGGGGGAGEQNDNYGGAGGAGGGIVYFLSYNNISGDGQVIANGNPGGNSTSPWGILGYDSDGAGGGGAGGTIILNAQGIVDGISIRANGGAGGSQNIISTNKTQAQGPGGGGGGGHIAVSNGTPFREALGGQNGTTNSSSLSEFPPNGATMGGAGTYDATISNVQLLAQDDTICSGNSAVLQASLTGVPSSSTIFLWHDSIVGGTILDTGNTFTTPILFSTTTYYVSYCPGYYRVPVTVEVIGANYSAGNNVSICAGNTTTLNASGGTNYQWAPSAGLSNPNIQSPVASPTVTTTYSVTISDNIGCTGTASVVVFVDSLSAFAGHDTTICQGIQVQLSASGGINYTWAPNPSLNQTNIHNPIASPTATTTYIVTVSDTTGCQGVDTVTVFVNPQPLANAGTDVQICQGDSIVLNATGGTDYSWQPSTGLNNPLLQNPTAFPMQTTVYWVTVTDSIGCTATDSVNVFVSSATAHISNDTTICQGSSVQLFASGGIHFIWTPGYALNDSLINNPIATPDSTTTYFVEVVDSIGCYANASVTISVINTIVADFSVSGLCQGDSTYFYDNSTDTHGNIVSWEWQFGDGHNSTSSDPTHLYNQAGSYDVTLFVENNYGCSAEYEETIQINEKPFISFTAFPTSICIPDMVTFSNLSNGAVNYQWLFGDGSGSTSENPSHLYQNAGTYTITLSGTSVNNCSSYAQQTITASNKPLAAFHANPVIGSAGNPVTFNNTSVGGNSWHWTFGDGTSSSVHSPTHTYSIPGTYLVTLIINNADNCSDTIAQEYIVEDNVTFYIPSAFSPDGDGLNDKFGPQGIGLNNEFYEMTVYDRWGQLIFHTNDVNTYWDGQCSTGTKCAVGVYTWVIFLKTHSGTHHTYRHIGTVTLL